MRTPAQITAMFAAGAHVVEVSVTAAASGEALPKTSVQLLPMGKIVGRDGRGPWLLEDLAHAERVVAASLATAGGTDIPIDYDHQIPFATGPDKGGQAKASGWIKGLTAKADGIWADVEWTPAAASAIASREYRYISPYFGFEQGSGRVTRIWNAGLVNLPNFTDLAAVASADLQGTEMDTKAIAKALGLAEDATPEQIATAAAALKTKADGATAAAVDPAQFVPMAAFTEVRDGLAAMQAASKADKAEAAVAAAMQLGKVTPAGREHALDLYRSNPAAFDAFVAAAPVVVAPGAVDTAAVRTDLDAPLTVEERAVASTMGVTEEAFLASKKQIFGAR